MAILADSYDEDLVHATTHGLMTRADVDYMRERVGRAVRTATGLAAKYLKTAQETLAKFDFGRLRDRVEAFRERHTRRWDEDRIRELVTLDDFQQAKPTMRRLIMAEPRVRQLCFASRLDGYEGYYEDDEPGYFGRDHTVYREVMNGAYVGTDEEDRFITYLGVADEITGDSELTHSERIMVRNSWSQIKAYLDQGKQDPTSPLRKTL